MKAIGIVVLLFFGWGTQCAQAVDLDAKVALQIPPQALATALIEFSKQTQLQIMSSGIDLTQRQTSGVNGRYSISQALDRLLAGTDLQYDTTGPNTIAVKSGAPTHTAAGQNISGNSDQLMRIAQLPADMPERPVAAEKKATPADAGQEIVVTGTNIRGVENKASPVITYDRQYIERSGFTTAQQIIQSLPQNFKGGDSGASEEGLYTSGAYTPNNETRAAGANLRGLGAVATLTLINGRRVAPSSNGQFVDISSIPIAAIERVEVLTDGASAIYGADAVAGVVNIILRSDFTGAETTLRWGTATEGSMSERQASQTLGTHWSGGSALIVGQYSYRDALDVTERSFARASFAPSNLLPQREQTSVMLDARQQLPAKFDVSANVMYSFNTVDSFITSSTNSFNRRLRGDTKQWNLFLGIGYEPFADWRFELGGALSELRPLIDMLDTSPVTGAVTSHLGDFHENFDQRSLDLKGDGTLFHLPAGAARMAVGASYREDLYHSVANYIFPAYGLTRTDVVLDVKSAFGELYVPVTRQLSLSVAGRYDEYSAFGSSTNPKVGVVWSPMESVDLRATYSTSFRTPITIEARNIGTPNYLYVYPFAAPNGGGTVPVIVLGGVKDIKPESSENITFGVTLRPQFAPGLKLTLDYFDIDYTDRITTPPFDTGVLARRAEFGSLIADVASDAAAQAFVQAQIAGGATLYDLIGTGTTGVRYIYDIREQNAARVKIKGFDLGMDYRFDVAQNQFNLNLNASHLGQIKNQLTSDSVPFDTVSTYANPIDWRLRAQGTWTRGGLSSTLALNHANHYVDDSALVDVPIASWTTIDLSLIYDFSGLAAISAFDGLKASFSVINLMDRNPPYTGSPFAIGYDPTNGSALGRFASFQISKRW